MTDLVHYYEHDGSPLGAGDGESICAGDNESFFAKDGESLCAGDGKSLGAGDGPSYFSVVGTLLGNNEGSNVGTKSIHSNTLTEICKAHEEKDFYERRLKKFKQILDIFDKGNKSRLPRKIVKKTKLSEGALLDLF